MRPIEDIQNRWAILDTSIGVDLRQAIRDGDHSDPCETGLRSVCWKAFLLYGPLSQTTWPKKLNESRGAYESLRNHFLRFIDHPNDLHSTADPLADDDTSPWSTLRQDETSREEIFQDVTRCMQDNYFFREPVTQKKLLDILFIYSKLNPDTGYRQGMHELLAPIIWVVQQDAIDAATVTKSKRGEEGTQFMVEVLDRKYIEHDAFSLFCAVMQSAKTYYEMGDNNDSTPIVSRSRRLHEELLAAVDPELALHLQVVGILPQIYAMRWMRLLFGREFEFKDVLQMWDHLFAENLRLEIIDMTCVAMLLRIRWKLIEADYTSAITTLTHFSLPDKTQDPRVLIKDAVYLDINRNADAGATLIQQYTGRRPKGQRSEVLPNRLRAEQTPVRARTPQHRPSPSQAPALLTSPQRQLESLFQEVSGGIQRRAEGWNVSKAVMGAVGEVRRNVNNLQTSHSRQSSFDILSGRTDTPSHHTEKSQDVEAKRLRKRVEELEQRNKVLAKMLENTLESLRATKIAGPHTVETADETFKTSLAKIQFVSVYLADSDIPLPSQGLHAHATGLIDSIKTTTETENEQDIVSTNVEKKSPPPSIKEPVPAPPPQERTMPSAIPPRKSLSTAPLIGKGSPTTRPSLNDSSFSFMLGENQHRSNFVSSVSALPEQRRDSETRARPKQIWAEEWKEEEVKGSESEDDGFTMSKLRGGQRA